MVDPEVGAVGTELLGGDRQLDRLEQRVGAERVPERAGDQWPNDRNPIYSRSRLPL